MSEYRLTKEIIDLSVSCRWDETKLEWSLREIYEVDDAYSEAYRTPIPIDIGHPFRF